MHLNNKLFRLKFMSIKLATKHRLLPSPLVTSENGTKKNALVNSGQSSLCPASCSSTIDAASQGAPLHWSLHLQKTCRRGSVQPKKPHKGLRSGSLVLDLASVQSSILLLHLSFSRPSRATLGASAGCGLITLMCCGCMPKGPLCL